MELLILMTLEHFEKTKLAQTFESEKNEKESAIMEKGTKHWSQVSNFAEENDDDFSKMALMPIYKI